jgi:sulfate adenylyltransferase/3'-phosphoadenosine 5'-phosphosulfate synthase
VAGFVVWFTGLSGSGKSTLAALLAAELGARGVHVEVLDGDEVRTHLSKGLTFSREDRDTNIRRIGFVAKLLARSGACAMTAAISPYRAIRDEQRANVENFVEVYCKASVPALAERDVKGLYKKALAGEIKGFTGVDDPYEEPLAPEVVAYTDRETKEESLARILEALEALGLVAAGGQAPATGGARLVRPHGGELVSRLVRGAVASELGERARAMRALDVGARELEDLEDLAIGALSPLKGFMNSKDYLKVVRSQHLETGLPWAVPVTLAASEEAAAGLERGETVALRAGGRVVALLEVDDVWRPDRALEAREVLGSADAAHPGVRALEARGPVYVGGEVRVLEGAIAVRSPTPAEARAALAARGHARVVAYATPGPMLRAGEHLARAALEAADALAVEVIEAPGAGLGVEAREAACAALFRAYFAAERVTLRRGRVARASAGRAAVQRALVAKTYGASHVAVELDEATRDDVKRAFDALSPASLGITPLYFEPVFYAPELGGMASAKTAPAGAAAVAATVDDVVARIRRGDDVPVELARPEVVAVVRAAVGALGSR